MQCPTSLSTFVAFCNKSYSDAPIVVAMQNQNLGTQTENPGSVVAPLPLKLCVQIKHVIALHTVKAA